MGRRVARTHLVPAKAEPQSAVAEDAIPVPVPPHQLVPTAPTSSMAVATLGTGVASAASATQVEHSSWVLVSCILSSSVSLGMNRVISFLSLIEIFLLSPNESSESSDDSSTH